MLGNSFSCIILSAFDIAEYHNELGFVFLMWAVLNLFFLFGALYINPVYIDIFFFVELAIALIVASYFATSDGKLESSTALKKTRGVFSFLAGLLGYYTMAHLACQTGLFFRFLIADTNKYFVRNTNISHKGE
ncbi:hypothetical protein N431DRAFT_499272 [Stipitochalara longipes BDJ]|nr:hypothetical protein N431DRAFT_499272 [Stipitochalara longipes BDJ]